ncbi:Mediator of RNA polymerase II transcription subunit 15 Mediator complex subunit 15 [Channa argus]|uniref:Mediator of RNA polymerase II transcription subunit 15 n=1 Tax=Channa argus TaxID=215402 RepID=A0A6G1QAU6_CHAAH|nr:Mediator of RNA polymerase II transcription subunit 15 Mediator complex subunit 15 [Channa argus]
MEVPGPDSDWRSPQFRQKVVDEIEEAMRKAGMAHADSSADMENHVYFKAKTRMTSAQHVPMSSLSQQQQQVRQTFQLPGPKKSQKNKLVLFLEYQAMEQKSDHNRIVGAEHSNNHAKHP